MSTSSCTTFDLARQHADNAIPNADYNEAFRLFNQVLNEHQNPSAPLAMIYLGALYCAGKGTERDSKKGSKLIEEGMARNREKIDPNFCFRLGKLHYDERVGDYENAITNPNFKGSVAGLTTRKQELYQAMMFFKMASAGGVSEASKYVVETQQRIKETLEKFIVAAQNLYNYHLNRYEESCRKFPSQDHSQILGFAKKQIPEIEKAEQELKDVVKAINAITDSTYNW